MRAGASLNYDIMALRRDDKRREVNGLFRRASSDDPAAGCAVARSPKGMRTPSPRLSLSGRLILFIVPAEQTAAIERLLDFPPTRS
jgi:hypothetical protein